MKYFIIYIIVLLMFIAIGYNRNSSNVKKVFQEIKTEIPDIYISSYFRLSGANHKTGRAIDIGSKKGSSLIKAFNKLCNRNDIRIGIGIEKADRHIHIDEFINEKKCKKRFLEISKEESYCVDNLSCLEVENKIKNYYTYLRN